MTNADARASRRPPRGDADRGGRRLPQGVLLAALLVLTFAGTARALDPHRALTQALLRKWQVQQGLPQPTILAIRQTADGYLWLGTQAGLFRFDGMRFVAAPVTRGVPLSGCWVNDLCEDREHTLWIATNDAGLVSWHAGAVVQYGHGAGLPSLNARCLLVDRGGNLWAGTDGGLARRSAAGQSAAGADVKVFRTEDGLAANDVRALCEAADGTIWVGGEGPRLGVWDGSAFSSRTLSSLPARASVRALLGARDGSVWIGTTAGLVRAELDHDVRIAEADGLADDAVDCLVESRDGSIWVGTKDGISRIQRDDIENFRTRDGLSQSTVFTLCEDHEGSVWVGTKHGLNQFVDRRTIPLTVSEGLPGNDTGPILQDQAGTIWVGTLGQGLARYDGRHFSLTLSTRQGLSSDSVLALADGGAGDLWVGTDRGLCRLRDDRVEECFTTEHGLPSNVVTCLCRDDRGTLWAGTTRGLAAFNAGRFSQPEGDAAAVNLPVLALVDLGPRGLAASTAGGALFLSSAGRLSPLPDDGGSDRQSVDAFYRDREGLLWMGTRGNGLRLLDGERTHRFTVKDGLYDDDLFGIVADNEDRLWMACSRGIFFISRGDLRRFAAGEISRLTSTPFSPTDAQRTVECQNGVQPAVFRMRDGRIWFSTIHGVIVIDPANMRRVLPLPAVVVEETQVNGQEVDLSHIPVFGPGRTNVYFRYTSLSYASPTRMTFRHRLEGFDKDWIDAGTRREAFYTNLPPGHYRFRVGAANLDGPWNEAAAPVELTLAPYFYQTGWFFPLAATLVALAAWAAMRLRLLQVKSRMNAVLGERSRIARELHDTLIQGFSGITMQMQALAARLRVSPEREQLEEIIQDAGTCLRDARRSVGGLRSALEKRAGLAEAIDQAARQLTETRDVRLLLQTEPGPVDLPIEVEYDIVRIAQEAVNNAVKHSGGRTIEVVMSRLPRHLCVTVRDDGSGFAVESHGHSLSGHYGLIGMRERAAQLHAELEINSAPGRGTLVRLTVPVNGAAETAALGSGLGR